MSKIRKVVCPECNETVEHSEALDRRNFLRTVGGGAAALAATTVMPTVAPSLLPAVAAQTPAPAAGAGQMRPAEALIRELVGTLTAQQRMQVVKPWDHRSAGMLTRHRMVNAPIGQRIGVVYTAPQRELCQRILRALCSDQTGYDRICRRENANRAFDGSGSFDGCGADIFGTVADNSQWAWVFSGHHITVRCDGDSEPNTAFGGPIYYGHTPDGYSQRNVFYHQTQAVMSVFESLNPQQRARAVVVGTPGEHEPSVRLQPGDRPRPGLPASEMSRGQRLLVQSVMREVLSPFRQEDGDEAIDILARTGGLDRLHLAFYRENTGRRVRGPFDARWHFWRLDGPGFVWNYRVLPHVHCYVNVAVPRQA
jgi:hypothetical protein